MEEKKEEEKFLATAAQTESNAGFEDINSDTLSITFIKLLQKLSPELDEAKPEYNKDAKVGMFTNSVTKELMGNKFKCIVIGFERIYAEWKPDRGGLVGYHSPAQATALTVSTKFGKWKTEEGNELIENYMYKVLIEGQEEKGIMVIAMVSSNITVAKGWNRELTTTIMGDGTKALPHFMVWEIGSILVTKGQNSWYKYEVKKAGLISKQQYELVAKERKVLTEKKIEYKGEEVKEKEALPENY